MKVNMSAQRELFDLTPVRDVQREYLGIKGLAYAPAFLDVDEQRAVLEEVNQLPWSDELKRRVQHYGYKYDYKARAISQSMYVGPLPSFAITVAQKLLDEGLLVEMPDQLIVNEYKPGQGITAHVDCPPCFKNIIATVSLGSACTMKFDSVATKAEKSCILEPGSALVLADEARYDWTHCIPARQTDQGIPRGVRVSLTFRNVILD